jgi:cysteine desulfurase
MTDRRIYLDFNASTPLAPEVVEAMQPFLTEHFGNPSSHHWAGAPAKAAVERARAQVAALLGCDPDEIVFTSGGSESNNHALKGVFFANRDRGEHIVTSAVEHPAILRPLRFLETLGAKVTVVPVDRHGRVNPGDVRKALTPRTILVSIMHANNEVGTVQPIAEIAAIARAAGVVMHTDAAQSVGKIPTRVDELGVDLLSVAGHKLYAPKGVGALFIRRGTRIEPFVHGAGHEQGRRAGTENVLLEVGLGAACEIAARSIGMPAVRELRDLFEASLKDRFGDKLTVNGAGAERLPNTANVNFVGQVGAEVLARLSGVAASTGSACHAGSVELSPVLAAMGVPPGEGMGAVRFSLGRTTSWEELEEVLSDLGAPRSPAPDRRSSREHWQNVHEHKAEDEVSWYQARPSTSLDLISGTGTGRDARIVDVGGGASRLVDAMLDAGFERVTVVDIATAALERAKRRLGSRASRVGWVTSDVTTWKPTGTFDVWHDRAVFHFMVRPEDRDAYRATLRRALRMGGHAIIGTFATDGPDRCSGLPVARYEPETLAAELGPEFRLVESVREEHVTPSGNVQRFQFSRFVRG